MTLTAMIWAEDEMFVALCPELDVASQGATIEAAQLNLQEAVEGVLAMANATELRRRMAKLQREPVAAVTTFSVGAIVDAPNAPSEVPSAVAA